MRAPWRFRERASTGRSGVGLRARRFWRAQRGAVAIETALALLVVVTTLAGLMEITHTVFTQDSLVRAARAAAREVSLMPEAAADRPTLHGVVCRAVRRELALAEDFDCDDAWTITVDAFRTPADLHAGTAAAGASPGGDEGDMIRVRIGRSLPAWLGWLLDGEDPDAVSMVATAVARNDRMAAPAAP